MKHNHYYFLHALCEQMGFQPFQFVLFYFILVSASCFSATLPNEYSIVGLNFNGFASDLAPSPSSPAPSPSPSPSSPAPSPSGIICDGVLCKDGQICCCVEPAPGGGCWSHICCTPPPPPPSPSPPPPPPPPPSPSPPPPSPPPPPPPSSPPPPPPSPSPPPPPPPSPSPSPPTEMVIPCGTSHCIVTHTCCCTRWEYGDCMDYGCCPYQNAVCCAGSDLCCPSDNTCDVEAYQCLPKNPVDYLGVMAKMKKTTKSLQWKRGMFAAMR